MEAALRRYLKGEVHKRRKEQFEQAVRVNRGMSCATISDDYGSEVERRFAEMFAHVDSNTTDYLKYERMRK